jgi:hypothetical protein
MELGGFTNDHFYLSTLLLYHGFLPSHYWSEPQSLIFRHFLTFSKKPKKLSKNLLTLYNASIIMESR